MDGAIFGMTWALELGHRNMLQELNPKIVLDCIMSRHNQPWNIHTKVQKLQTIIRQIQDFRCRHTYTLANVVADTLAKHSHALTSPQKYFNS